MTSTVGILGYPLHRHTLTNGLRVIVSPDHSAPVVALNLWYDVGSRDELLGQTGLAHLFEHLMFQGSANVASGEHLATLQANGGSVNATTWFDRTNYFAAMPTGALNLALWLEADRLATLPQALTVENLDNQREVVKEEKRQRYDNVPYGDVIEHLVALTFPAQHPYGHTTIGSMADLDAASVQDAISFFTRHYLPGNAVLTLVGDIEPADAFARVQKYFGKIPAGNRSQRASVTPLPPHTGVPRARTAAPVPADACYFTWRLPVRDTQDFNALDLTFSILGDGQTSRLHRRLVREDKIAQAASSSALALIGGNSFGFAYARAMPGTTVADLEYAMVSEIDRLVHDGPQPAEIERAKAQYEREWLSELSRFDARADQFGAYATLHGDPQLVNTRIADITAITGDDIVAACGRWLRSEQRAVLSYERTNR
ncbi:MAG: pitrilysin family protein [Micropruina sp.]